jgi:hypothetical protein
MTSADESQTEQAYVAMNSQLHLQLNDAKIGYPKQNKHATF